MCVWVWVKHQQFPHNYVCIGYSSRFASENPQMNYFPYFSGFRFASFNIITNITTTKNVVYIRFGLRSHPIALNGHKTNPSYNKCIFMFFKITFNSVKGMVSIVGKTTSKTFVYSFFFLSFLIFGLCVCAVRVMANTPLWCTHKNVFFFLLFSSYNICPSAFDTE